MKVCGNCVNWSQELKGTCRLTRQGVGQFASCRNWRETTKPGKGKSDQAWKGLPN